MLLELDAFVYFLELSHLDGWSSTQRLSNFLSRPGLWSDNCKAGRLSIIQYGTKMLTNGLWEAVRWSSVLCSGTTMLSAMSVNNIVCEVRASSPQSWGDYLHLQCGREVVWCSQWSRVVKFELKPASSVTNPSVECCHILSEKYFSFITITK